jgi:hypothetical protein
MRYECEIRTEQGLAEPLYKYEIRASCDFWAWEKAINVVHGWRSIYADMLFPNPPGTGEEEALGSKTVLVSVKANGRLVKKERFFLQPPFPECTAPRRHDWRFVGSDDVCQRCKLVMRKRDFGYVLFYLPQEEAPACSVYPGCHPLHGKRV